jgi:cathepsin L
MTNAEYRQKILSPKRTFPVQPSDVSEVTTEVSTPNGNPLNPKNPASVDWKAKGAVTPIKDQGQCGSCWAFSSTGSIESAWFNSRGKLVSLSESQLVDCSGSYGNEGCDGGLMSQAFDYIIDLGWIETEAGYPYVPDDRKCTADKSKLGASITRYVNITSMSDVGLENAAVIGSVSVAIDASSDDFQFYGGGIFSEVGCSQTDLDHGVLVVGYDYLSGTPYWQVKNSWGLDWGDNGYIKMRKAKTPTDGWKNMCGIATQASQPYV